jgi:hypothetical protein
MLWITARRTVFELLRRLRGSASYSAKSTALSSTTHAIAHCKLSPIDAPSPVNASGGLGAIIRHTQPV